jgi:hypothetical protein
MDDYDPAENAECLAERFQQLSDSHWYALVDLSCVYDAPLPSWFQYCFSFYESTPWKKLATLSPTLYALSLGSADELAIVIKRLLTWCNGKPMLSFWASQKDQAALINHWQRYLNLNTTEGDHYLLRFADTRVLASLPTVLNSEHWSQLTSPLETWLIINRAGQLQELPCKSNNLTVLSETPITLSASELAALIDASEPDAIVQVLEKDFSELLQSRSRAALFHRIAFISQQAKRHQITTFLDVVAMATVELSMPDEYSGQWLKEPGVQTLFSQKSWADGQLSVALSEVLA